MTPRQRTQPLLTAHYEPALLGMVRSWHATVYDDGRVEQLVAMREEGLVNQLQLVHRAFYAQLEKEELRRLRRALSSTVFHDLEGRYDTPEGLLHFRELNATDISEGAHRVSTRGACSLARLGDADMIVFMGIWERVREALPFLVEEPDEHRSGLPMELAAPVR